MKLLTTLPAPPGECTGSAREIWEKTGRELQEQNRLTEESLDLLENLCFWVRQKEEVMKRFTGGEQDSGRGAKGKPDTSLLLSNLRAIQREMDQVRERLGLPVEREPKMRDTPSIPDTVYEHLPDLIWNGCSEIENNRYRDLFLTALLPVVASHLTGVLVEHADGCCAPNLFSLVVNRSGRGEKLVQKAVKTGSMLHAKRVKGQKQEYQDLPRLYLEPGTEKPDLRNEIAGNRGRGLLLSGLEGAAETSQQPGWWKLFAEIAVKAFYHETVQIEANGKTTLIHEPELSAVFTGELEQVRQILEQEERDYFSLYALYIYDAPETWQSLRADSKTRKLHEYTELASRELDRLNSILAGRNDPLFIELTPYQWEMIDETFAEKMTIIRELDLPRSFHRSNKRAAILALKLTALFSVTRLFEDNPELLGKHETAVAADSDLIAALWLADTYIKHAIRLFQMIPSPARDVDQGNRGERYLRFLDILPAQFKTSEAMKMAGKVDIPVRTAKRYLSELLKVRKIERLRHGVYRKVATNSE